LDVKDFLIKPVEKSVLADTLTRWQALYVPSSVPAGSPATAAFTQPSEEHVIKADPKLVEIFIKEATQRLDSLRQALASSDAQRAAREAHTLKSSSAYFQAHAMHDAAEQLEKMADSGKLNEAKPVLNALEDAYARLRAYLEKDRI
jgi:HPt (histidine-containing phosphotransfer) domain-containing protein